jgi:hypothetical protein
MCTAAAETKLLHVVATRRAWAGCAVLLLLAAALPAAGADGRSLAPADYALLERLATARARMALLEQVGALPLDEDLTVAAWAQRTRRRARGLHLWIRTLPRYGEVQVYSDGTADVAVRLEPGGLRGALERLQSECPGIGVALDARALRRAEARWPVLWSTGTARLSDRPSARKPIGWENVTFDGMEHARRAAEADALLALLARIGDLALPDGRKLGAFLEADDGVRSAVAEALEQSAAVTVSFAPDRVAVGEARIGTRALLRLLIDVHGRLRAGDAFHAADFRAMALAADAEELSATGLAAPAESAIVRPQYVPLELDVPAWAGEALRAVGVHETSATEASPSAELIGLARLDGIDRLRRQVEALVLQHDVTVAEFLGTHEELKDDVIIFLSGARLAGLAQTPAAGVVTVPVELPLERLWRILRRGMEVVEALPEAAGAQPTEKVKP